MKAEIDQNNKIQSPKNGKIGDFRTSSHRNLTFLTHFEALNFESSAFCTFCMLKLNKFLSPRNGKNGNIRSSTLQNRTFCTFWSPKFCQNENIKVTWGIKTSGFWFFLAIMSWRVAPMRPPKKMRIEILILDSYRQGSATKRVLSNWTRMFLIAFLLCSSTFFVKSILYFEFEPPAKREASLLAGEFEPILEK